MLTRQSKAYQAARAMADNHIGSVLVSEPKALAGIVTDRDLALAVLGGGIAPRPLRLHVEKHGRPAILGDSWVTSCG